MRRSSLPATIAVLALSASAGPVFAQDAFGDAFWQFSAVSGFDFTSGYYGAAKRTEVLYIPVTLQAAKGPWTFKAVVPWLRVSGPALLVGGSAGEALGVRTSGSASGLGDIILSAGYSLERFYNYGLYIDLSARVKAPSASVTQGLGTGEWDGAFQIDVAKALGDFMPFAQLGYRVTGQPAGFALRNVVFGSVGLQYAWNPRITTGVAYDVRQPAIATAAVPQEGMAYLNYRFSEDWSANVYGVVGFSRNSPSAGGGMMVTYRWR
jgi:hypothetical protein